MRLLTLRLFAFLLLPLCCAAQKTLPEFKNTVMFVSFDSSLFDMDKTELRQDSKVKFITKSLFLTAPGNTASVQVPAKEAQFIVRVEPFTDPETVVELFACTADGINRKIEGRASIMRSRLISHCHASG